MNDDPRAQRIIAGGLVVIVVAVILAATSIVIWQPDKEIPEILVAIGSGAVGAIAGLAGARRA